MSVFLVHDFEILQFLQSSAQNGQKMFNTCYYSCCHHLHVGVILVFIYEEETNNPLQEAQQHKWYWNQCSHAKACSSCLALKRTLNVKRILIHFQDAVDQDSRSQIERGGGSKKPACYCFLTFFHFFNSLTSRYLYSYHIRGPMQVES